MRTQMLIDTLAVAQPQRARQIGARGRQPMTRMNWLMSRRICCWRGLKEGRGSDTIRLYGIGLHAENQPRYSRDENVYQTIS